MGKFISLVMSLMVFVVFFSRMGKIDPDRIGELFEELERFIR